MTYLTRVLKWHLRQATLSLLLLNKALSKEFSNYQGNMTLEYSKYIFSFVSDRDLIANHREVICCKLTDNSQNWWEHWRIARMQTAEGKHGDHFQCRKHHLYYLPPCAKLHCCLEKNLRQLQPSAEDHWAGLSDHPSLAWFPTGALAARQLGKS